MLFKRFLTPIFINSFYDKFRFNFVSKSRADKFEKIFSSPSFQIKLLWRLIVKEDRDEIFEMFFKRFYIPMFLNFISSRFRSKY